MIILYKGIKDALTIAKCYIDYTETDCIKFKTLNDAIYVNGDDVAIINNLIETGTEVINLTTFSYRVQRDIVSNDEFAILREKSIDKLLNLTIKTNAGYKEDYVSWYTIDYSHLTDEDSCKEISIYNMDETYDIVNMKEKDAIMLIYRIYNLLMINEYDCIYHIFTDYIAIE